MKKASTLATVAKIYFNIVKVRHASDRHAGSFAWPYRGSFTMARELREEQNQHASRSRIKSGW
jgi:hypothetical protein|tara:strand:+ start:819 stop:1007 length:189 start_codon:yes stop_codon:yes gene_type:complete